MILASGLLLFGTIYWLMARRWPDVFADAVQLRGPKFTLSRAIILVAVMLLWAAALIWASGSKLISKAIGGFIPPRSDAIIYGVCCTKERWKSSQNSYGVEDIVVGWSIQLPYVELC